MKYLSATQYIINKRLKKIAKKVKRNQPTTQAERDWLLIILDQRQMELKDIKE
jgi:hypothetical protein